MRTNMYDGAADNDPLRGGKSSVLEGGIRVTIINWPRKLTDADYDDLHVTDLLATLMDAATGGANTGQLTDGKSMWSALAEDREIAASDFVTMGLDGKAFFSGRWKLIARNNGALQLYDIIKTKLKVATSHRSGRMSLKNCRNFCSPHRPVRHKYTVVESYIGPGRIWRCGAESANG